LQRWRWSRCGLWVKRGFGEMKCLFSTTLELRKETEANGGHRGDRTLHRTRPRCDRTRLVSTAQQLGARARVCNRRVQSLTGPARSVRRPEGTAVRKDDQTRCASGHTRSDASGRQGSLLDSNRTLAQSHPVVAWSASGRCFVGTGAVCIGASGRCMERIRSLLHGRGYCVTGASGRLSSASGHCV
jgi:hypothetical protein